MNGLEAHTCKLHEQKNVTKEQSVKNARAQIYLLMPNFDRVYLDLF